MKLTKKTQSGFSLIELLIVVVIIGIIAAIAIPNLLAARRAANEGSAQASLRTIHGAQATYQGTQGNGNYTTLTNLATASLINPQLGAAGKSGYAFGSDFTVLVIGTTPASHCEKATPTTYGNLTGTGTRDFAIATQGVIYAWPAPTVAVATCGPVAGQSTIGPVASSNPTGN